MDGAASQPISFSGSLNTDLDLKSIKLGDYIEATNMRNIYTENGIDGSLENISANTLVSFTLPNTGANKCIGTYEDVANNTVFYFIYNSSSYHQILRYYAATGQVQVILDGTLQSPNVGLIMNFTEWGYITNVNLVDNLLYWIDSTGLQRYINCDRANNFSKTGKFKLCFSVPPLGYGASTQVINYVFNGVHGSPIPITITLPTGITSRFGVAAYAYTILSGSSLITTEFTIVNFGDYIEFTENFITSYVVPIVDIVITAGTTQSWYIPENYYSAVYSKTLDPVVQPLWLQPATVLANDTTKTQNLLNGNAYQFTVRIYGVDGRISVLSKSSEMMFYNLIANTLGETNITNYLDYTQNPTPSNCIKVNYSDNSRLFLNSAGHPYRELVTSVEILVRNLNTEVYRSVAIIRDFELDGTYTFYNESFGSAISTNDHVKQYDAIPVSSQCQEVVNNKLFYGNNVLGYDTPVINAGVLCSNSIQTFDTYLNMRPKYFGKYNLGIVYFDKYGRNPFVTRTDNLVLNILPPTNSYGSNIYNRPICSWGIGSLPPIWATHYAWVRTKDLVHQYYTFIPAHHTYPSPNYEATYYDATMNTVTWASGNVRYAIISCDANTPYTFTQGDQLRIVKFGHTTPFAYIGNDTVSVESYDSSATPPKLKVSYNQSANTSLQDITGFEYAIDFMQVFTPHQIQENELYYEFSECYEIGDYGTANAYHKGGFQGSDQTVSGGVSTGNATGWFYKGWDTFHLDNFTSTITTNGNTGDSYGFSTETQSDNITLTRTDTFKTVDVPNPPQNKDWWNTFTDTAVDVLKVATFQIGTGYLGTEGVNNNTGTHSVTTDTVQITPIYSRNLVTGIGRPNVVIPTNKQITDGQNIQYSNVYNIGTNYNGFGSFEPLSSSDVPYGYGSINKLINVENIMLAICAKKSFSIYIDKGILQTQTGDTQISNSTNVLGALRYLEGSNGTINPESFGRTTKLVFWWDAYNGEVCQYSANGVDIVSKYGRKNFFAKKGIIGLQAVVNGTYKVLGVVHKRFNEYIMSFNNQIVNSVLYPAETLGYSYNKNGWNCNYSYFPEMIGESGQNIVSFKNGTLWLHTENTVKNKFYGLGLQGVGTVALDATKLIVTGTGTTFLADFKVGDSITILTSAGDETRTILTITSNTVLTVSVAFTGTAAENPYYLASFPCQIVPVVNIAPSSNKTFLSLSAEGRGTPNIPIIQTPITDWNTSGQLSELLESDFEFINGSYFASFLNNKLTPNAANQIEALISGEALQGQTMTLKFSKFTNSLYVLKSAECYLISDALTNG